MLSDWHQRWRSSEEVPGRCNDVATVRQRTRLCSCIVQAPEREGGGGAMEMMFFLWKASTTRFILRMTPEWDATLLRPRRKRNMSSVAWVTISRVRRPFLVSSILSGTRVSYSRSCWLYLALRYWLSWHLLWSSARTGGYRINTRSSSNQPMQAANYQLPHRLLTMTTKMRTRSVNRLLGSKYNLLVAIQIEVCWLLSK